MLASSNLCWGTKATAQFYLRRYDMPEPTRHKTRCYVLQQPIALNFTFDFGKTLQIERWVRIARDELVGRKKAVHCRSLSVNRVQRKSCLKSGKHVNWIWRRNTDELARTVYRAEQDLFELNYKEHQYGGDRETIT